MFERYTEKARRVVFFARYEASQYGSPWIETEHILLGLLREDKLISKRFFKPGALDDIRKEIDAHTKIREKVSTSVDLPLSNECKRVLAYAAEEAERLSHKHIGTEHMLLGLLREEKSFAAELLRERGLQLASVRETLASHSGASESHSPDPEESQGGLFIDLTAEAIRGRLPQVIGRRADLQRLIQVLGRSTKRNAMLVGERGSGRRSVVLALAQGISHGGQSEALAGKIIMELDLATMLRQRWSERLLRERRSETLDMPGLPYGGNVIYFVPDLPSLLLAPAEMPLLGGPNFRRGLLKGTIQCISTTTPEMIRRAGETNPWLLDCFSQIHVAPATAEETHAILISAKERFEKHHSVSYSVDAVRYAVIYAERYVPNRALPDKALDLLDEAGSWLRSQVALVPPEIMDLRNKLRLTTRNMENAIANHEFQKARLFSDEEKEVREQLQDLEKKLHMGEAKALRVTRAAIEEVVAGWTGISVEEIRKSEPNHD